MVCTTARLHGWVTKTAQIHSLFFAVDSDMVNSQQTG
jgi:hypothetical protein